MYKISILKTLTHPHHLQKTNHITLHYHFYVTLVHLFPLSRSPNPRRPASPLDSC
jgi:hypothetical protein